MLAATRKIPFKVDIAGVIHIMGSALYSRPEAAIRELIQNAHDAVQRRRQTDAEYRGRIDVRQNAENHSIEFSDDGFGLSAEEAERYLGTLGIGVTGLLKGKHPAATAQANGADELIGMFGIGLFSAFMLCDQLVVESRRLDLPAGVRWSAGDGTEIEIGPSDREAAGTTITLYLKPQHLRLAQDAEILEDIIKEYGDFLPVPVFLNDGPARLNVIQAAWFDPTPDREAIELELATYFDESPLDVIPLQIHQPANISGALYVSPRRTPGFSGDAVLTATVRQMVISRHIQGLLPDWASFLRGVLELSECSPTASREDLVRDHAFAQTRDILEQHLLEHFERLAQEDPARFESVLSWHRYSWAGAALSQPRLRTLLRQTYQFPTSQGMLTFAQIFEQSAANPIFESEFDRVIWYNTDRRQENWINGLFTQHTAPCVHTLRSFEESLLAGMVADVDSQALTTLRLAAPASEGFALQVLEMEGLEDAPPEWQEFLGTTDAKIRCASFRTEQPVMAFLNEKHDLMRTFEDLKKTGTVPAGFQRLIDTHFQSNQSMQNEVLLNRSHRLVARALEQKTNSPLASVLRLLVINALTATGATVPQSAQRGQVDDLDWIAECLWGRE